MAQDFQLDTRAFEARLRVIAAELAEPVTAEIVSVGPASKYAFVLEKGSAPGAAPWPEPKAKTTKGKGGRVFSKQAPSGFIARHAKAFLKFLRDALHQRIRASKKFPDRDVFVAAANDAAEDALQLAKASAPVDSGALRDSLTIRKAE